VARDITSTIRFVGDANQLISTYGQVKRSAQELQAEINRTNAQAVKKVFRDNGAQLSPYSQGIRNVPLRDAQGNPRLSPKGVPITKPVYDTQRPYIAAERTEIDLLNKSLLVTRDMYIRTADGGKQYYGQFKESRGDINQVLEAEGKINQVRSAGAQALAPYARQIKDVRQQLNQFSRDEAQAAALQIERNKANQGFLGSHASTQDAQLAVNRQRQLITDLENKRARGPGFGATADQIVTPQQIAAARAELGQLEAILAERQLLLEQSVQNLARLEAEARAAQARVLATQDAGLKAGAEQDLARLRAQAAEVRGQIAAEQKALATQREGALLTPTPTPQIFQTLGKQSPETLKGLKGLGVDLSNPEIAKNFRVTEDLIHGVKTLNGAYEDQNGVLRNVAVSYDKAGVPITRFGGAMSGVQNFLKQTVNNLQKVIQWGIATTIVITGLSVAFGQVRNIIDLDKTLNRFSITAQLTSEQTKSLFNDIAQVASDTATPLEELVNSADDIALATRRAGQTTGEWQAEIVDLTKAVGILTNLTGLDTVKATELLTSSMKQLKLHGSDLITVLNKITAVAGGQSVAIADLVEGLGQMAEAAQTSGLSFDQTLGTLQVLSQVTSKSSKEVATSFKNLTGSLGGPAALKVLDKYNIDVKDQAGNLRNIIDVYRDVAEALRNGTIAAGDFQKVLRALAGGPRRLPDAAALISSIDQIDEVTKKSASATNEALLANAKVLDTVQAKLTQLSVAFEKFVFDTFGQGLKSGISQFIDLMHVLINVLSIIPPQTYGLALQFTGLTVAFKIAGAIFSKLLGNFGGLNAILGLSAVSYKAETAAIEENTVALEENAAASATANKTKEGAAAGAGGFLGLGSFSSLGKGKIAAGIGLGAAVGLGGGLLGIDKDQGQNLQSLGLTGLLLLPGPLKLIGAAALAAGTAISVFGKDTKDAAKDTADLQQQLLTGIQAQREAQQVIAGLKVEQGHLIDQYSALNKSEKSRKENAGLIASTLERYGQTTIELAGANDKLQDSYNKLNPIIGKYQNQILSAKNGAYDLAQLNALNKKIATDIFTTQNPNFNPNGGGTQLRPAPFLSSEGPVNAEVTTVHKTPVLNNANASTTTVAKFDEVALKGEAVLNLFDKSGTQMIGTFSQTAQTVDVIRTSLETLAQKEGDVGNRAKEALKTFNGIAATLDAGTGVDTFVKYQQAYIQAAQLVGSIGGDQADNAQKNLSLITRLMEATSHLAAGDNPRREGQTGVSDQAKAQQDIISKLTDSNNNISTGFVDLGSAKKFLEILQIIQPLEANGVKLTSDQIAKLAIASGINVKISNQLKAQADTQEKQVKAEEDINALRRSNLDDLAKKTLQIQQQFLTGDITAKQRDAMIAGAQASKQLQDQMGNLFKDIATNQPVLSTLEQQLSDIPGLEGLVGLNAQDAAKDLDAWVSSMDLTKKGAKALIAHIVALIAALKAIPPNIKAKIQVQVEVAAAKEFKQSNRDESPGDARKDATKAGQQADKKGAADYVKGIVDQINDALKGISSGTSKGSSFLRPKPTKDKKGLDVSELDLPDQIAASKKRDALIQEAIKNAKSLQNKIPGANKDASNDVVELLNGTKRILEVRGLKEEYLRRALEELTKVEQKRVDLDVSTTDLPDEIANSPKRGDLIQEAIKRARALQHLIPGADKEAKNDVVELLKGTQRVLEVRGIKDDFLRKALEELAAIEKKRLDFDTKADAIRQIRIGGGDFAAIANVPVNTKTGVSLAGNNGGNITLNINGQVLTPAQLSQFADLVAAALKRNIAN
jgi:TP901 family phage tail tape measure protein